MNEVVNVQQSVTHKNRVLHTCGGAFISVCVCTNIRCECVVLNAEYIYMSCAYTKMCINNVVSAAVYSSVCLLVATKQ
jgi:hypothetical protein